jgi:hypothetical protein
VNWEGSGKACRPLYAGSVICDGRTAGTPVRLAPASVTALVTRHAEGIGSEPGDRPGPSRGRECSCCRRVD